jgi:uncharacterized membrane protein YdjX (TVP38/TMEM64 family)
MQIFTKRPAVSRLTAKLLIAFLLLAVLVFAARFFPVISGTRELCRWVSQLGLVGLALISVLLAVGSVCLLPATPFVIAAAAVFGFPLGVLASIAGFAMGSSAGFLLSRAFLRNDVVSRLKIHPTFRAIDIAVEREGWKIVLLLRLCPIPFGLANYLYGLTGVPFCQYLLASIVGSLPAALLFCQLGSAGKVSLDAIASGNIAGGVGQIFLLAHSVLVTVGAILLLPRFARNAVAKYAKVTIPFSSPVGRPQKS